ncbi:PREDICTED: uncharacterized protein LOC106725928 isoform X1 [Myotis brandtii]|uniref:uncharacterized protein LOC106725928 isoform X1 n=1 Tax=Myotis brandtii TaxID=109478 RepID=UPI0007047681|nr:PREDICTED: uncharacterized protein LOC106725928 isoform X1 [Myotis brandtii]
MYEEVSSSIPGLTPASSVDTTTSSSTMPYTSISNFSTSAATWFSSNVNRKSWAYCQVCLKGRSLIIHLYHQQLPPPPLPTPPQPLVNLPSVENH